ncbi:hypothetical protein LEP3755_24500 [Leptolyngbya sp. NIES-3755]|nr:hypothetical protein LEP3755_24500 [Leptolyngbya sp. NIES-3755]
MISRIDQPESDPVLEQFLEFLAEDIRRNPQQIQAVNPELVDRLRTLTADVEVSLDAPLLDQNE